MRGVATAVAVILSSCYSPHYEDCVISCASQACPSGFDCRAGMCRPTGTQGTCGATSDGPIGVDGMADAAYPSGAWGTPVEVPLGITDTQDPSLTADLLEMYITYSSDIYVSTRPNATAAWEPPHLVQELSSSSADATPSVSADGLTMLVSSDRPPTMGSLDIYISTRSARDVAWTPPMPITAINSTQSDQGASLTADRLAIVLGSSRSGLSDLYITRRGNLNAPWSVPVALTELNTSPYAESHPSLSPDELTVYFISDRSGGGDIYVAHRAQAAQPFNAPTPIAELDTPGNVDSDPWVSPDGHHMFFTSDISGVLRVYETSR